MKKTTLILPCALAFFSAGFLQADEALFDARGFEEPAYTVGNLAGQQGWTGSPQYAVVQRDTVHEGQQAVQLCLRGTGYSMAKILFPARKRLVVDVWICPQVKAYSPLKFAYTPATGRYSPSIWGEITLFPKAQNKRFLEIGLARDGSLLVNRAPVTGEEKKWTESDTPEKVASEILAPYVPNTWQHIVIECDLTKSVFAVTFQDGERSGEFPFIAPFDDSEDILLQFAVGGVGVTEDLHGQNYEEMAPLLVIDDLVVKEQP